MVNIVLAVLYCITFRLDDGDRWVVEPNEIEGVGVFVVRLNACSTHKVIT